MSLDVIRAYEQQLAVYRFDFGEYDMKIKGTNYVFKISSNYHEHYVKHRKYMREDCYWLRAECKQLGGVTLIGQVIANMCLLEKITNYRKMMKSESPILRFTSCRNGLILTLNPKSAATFKFEVHFHGKGRALLDALDADIDRRLLEKIKKDDADFYEKCKKEGIPVND